MNQHLRFADGSPWTRRGTIAALAACALALPFTTSCQSGGSRLLSVSESVPPRLAKDKPFIHAKFHLFTAPRGFSLLEQTEGNHLGGVYSPQDGEKLVRALERRRGVDLISVPSLTVRPGEESTIESFREFVYPTQYDPPKTNADSRAIDLTGSVGAGFPITPAQPSKFEKTKLGTMIKFEGRNNSRGVIDFELDLTHRHFRGFVNYGSPIQVPARNAFGMTTPVVITENRIEMPVISTRRISSTISLADGHYIALGGHRPRGIVSLDGVEFPHHEGPDIEKDKAFFVLVQVVAVDKNGN